MAQEQEVRAVMLVPSEIFFMMVTVIIAFELYVHYLAGKMSLMS